MAQQFGVYGPAHPWLGELGYRLSLPLVRAMATARHLYAANSPLARERRESMRHKLARGEPVYLLGLGPGGHNAGAALVEVTRAGGIRLLRNNEEERFTGIKHYADYPALSVDELRCQLDALGLSPADIHAGLAGWDYVALVANSIRLLAEELPGSLYLAKPQPRETFLTDYRVIFEAFSAPRRLGQQLGLGRALPLINLRHHDNHACFAWAVSPFARSDTPVMVAIVDGSGDDGAISLYLARAGRLKLVYNNRSMFDSLGTLYTMLSATQGGWTPLSSEGRYMGASAWGDGSRLTNPYYRPLRQLLYFGPNGQIFLNRALANWHRGGYAKPYTPALTQILGPPILPAQMWNPDRLLKLDDARHLTPATRERLDKAAAVQLLLEDALFHLIDHFIRATGSHQLVFAGGTALNCLANMRLLEQFDESYYRRALNRPATRLHLWAPPVAGDAGAPAGAAFHFALTAGAQPGPPLAHAFYCGRPPTRAAILAALHAEPEIACEPLDGISAPEVADLLAWLVAQNGIVGLFQGVAETGPRALGHRSILANPCRADTLRHLNERVKFREPFRPLAPMLTLQAAHLWFELSPGAAPADYNAYNYMALTARAKPQAHRVIPAVIHKDGTGRLQIVRPEIDPFSHAYLKALGRRIGVEVSVNTSLNVGGPIAQTPAQALVALKRARALTGLLLIADTGESFLAWHNSCQPPKDGGRQLRQWLSAWRSG